MPAPTAHRFTVTSNYRSGGSSSTQHTTSHEAHVDYFAREYDRMKNPDGYVTSVTITIKSI